MKLKEKLALERAEANACEFVDDIENYYEGYLAGFEKARQMALDAEDKYLQEDYVLQAILEGLGEEEV